MTGTGEDARIERLLREALTPLECEPPTVPAELTRGVVRRGGRLRRVRRAAVAVVPVMAAAVVVLTVLSVQANTPAGRDRHDTGPAGGVNAQGWQRAERSPLSPRGGATLVAAGREILVLGGSSAAPCPPNALCVPPTGHELRDGAAYDPARNAWRTLADAPVGLLDVSADEAGGEVYVLTRPAEKSSVQRLFSYSVADDRWTSLPSPPSGLDSVVAVGDDRLIGYHSSHESTWQPDQIYDVRSRAWTAMPRDPLAPSRDRNLIATDSGDVVLVAVDRPSGPGGRDIWRAAVWNSKTLTWKEFPRSEIVDSDPAWWWAAGRVVNPSTQVVDGGGPAGGMLDPGTGAWAPIPAPAEERRGVPLPATAGGNRVFASGQVLDVEAGTWWPVPVLPESFPSQDASVGILGDYLVVAGGARFGGSIKGTLTSDTWVLRLPG